MTAKSEFIGIDVSKKTLDVLAHERQRVRAIWQ